MGVVMTVVVGNVGALPEIGTANKSMKKSDFVFELWTFLGLFLCYYRDKIEPLQLLQMVLLVLSVSISHNPEVVFHFFLNNDMIKECLLINFGQIC